jgi:hypothetical protein
MADDGLQWLLSLDVEKEEALGFLKTLDKMTSSLKGAKTETEKVEHATRAAGEGHKKHGEGAKELHGILDRLNNAALDPLLHRLKQYAEFEFVREGIEKLLELPGEIIEKLKELGVEMVTVAARAERTNLSFSLLFGADQGSEVLEYIEHIGDATEFTQQALKGAAQNLAKVGFAGQGLTRAMAASLDIAAFSPDKAAGFSEALSSLERIKRTGRVDNRVLGGLGIGQIPFLKELSARTGQEMSGLKKKLEAGKIDAETALETLYTMISKKTGKDLGGAGVDMSKTLEARLTRLKQLPELFFEKLAKTDAFDKLSGAADRLLEKLNPEGATGKKIFEALERGASAVVDAIDSIDVDKIGHALVSLSEDVKPVIGAFEKLGHAISQVVKGIDAVVNSKFGEIVGMTVRGTGAVVKHAGEGLLSASGAAPIIDGLANYLKGPAATAKVAGAGEHVGDAVAGGTEKKLGIQSPSKVFADLGRQTVAGYELGVKSASGALDNVMAGAFAVPAPQGGRVAALGGNVSVVVGDIHVTTGPHANAQEIGEAVVRAVESALPGALKSGLDQMAAQGGEN